MNYYLIKIVINDKGQDGTSIQIYPDLDSAILAYHQTAAAFRSASDVRHSVVEILDKGGIIVGGTKGYREENDHPAPEPEPEPTEE